MIKKNFSDIYNNDEYAALHNDWHMKDFDAKVKDLSIFCEPLTKLIKADTIVIADIGSGLGGVLNGVVKKMSKLSGKKISGVAFEISEYAFEKGKSMYSDLEWINRQFRETDGPYDTIMFIDVLEHVENPWEILRLAANISTYMLIRQPLLDNYSNFRNNDYKNHREKWGHIALYNYRSFIDMATATGWEKCQVKLVAPWELNTDEGKTSVPLWKKVLSNFNNEHLSYFINGFYLNGIFKSKVFNKSEL